MEPRDDFLLRGGGALVDQEQGLIEHREDLLDLLARQDLARRPGEGGLHVDQECLPSKREIT